MSEHPVGVFIQQATQFNAVARIIPQSIQQLSGTLFASKWRCIAQHAGFGRTSRTSQPIRLDGTLDAKPAPFGAFNPHPQWPRTNRIRFCQRWFFPSIILVAPVEILVCPPPWRDGRPSDWLLACKIGPPIKLKMPCSASPSRPQAT